MNDQHLSSDPSFDFAVETLLRSAENDRPPPASLGKTAALLGVSVAPLLTSSAAAAAGLGGGAAKASVATATQVGFLGLGVSVGKVATVGALIVGGLGVTLSQTWQGGAEPAADHAARPTSGGAKVSSPSPVVESTKTVESTKAVESTKTAAPQLSPNEDLPASPEPQVKAPRVASAPSSLEAPKAPPSPSQGGDSLGRELRFLSFARAALQRGDGAGCLSAVEDYRSEFPTGALSVEAAVLRVEALLLTSGKEAAQREAEALRKRMPHSMHLRRFVALGLLEEDAERLDDPAQDR